MILWQNSYNPKKKREHKASQPKPFVPDFLKQLSKPGVINDGTEKHTTEDIHNILLMPRV